MRYSRVAKDIYRCKTVSLQDEHVQTYRYSARSAVSNGTQYIASFETQGQGCLEPTGDFNVGSWADPHEAFGFLISTAKVDKFIIVMHK